jgi:hydroxyacylglutathione hydrolase
MVQVFPVPAFADNYLWVVHNDRFAVAVDPGDASPVIDFLTSHDLTLSAILCTHHHADHVGGVNGLLDFLRLKDKIPVYGPANEKIPAITNPLREGDTVSLPTLGLEFAVLDVPGHTAGHIAYFGQDMLFCGDTLFACGCGRLFEGTAAQMAASLNKLRHLPGHTRVYCAHEYTMANIKFAEAVEPGNADLKLRKAFCAAKRHRNEPTLPSTISLEIATNPFIRWDALEVIASAEAHAGHSLNDDVAVFAAIREWKNKF